MSPTYDELLPSAAAAAMVQPYLENMDATQWLMDMRRSKPKYARRVPLPKYERKRGRAFYWRSEVETLIVNLRTGASAKPFRAIGARPILPPALAASIAATPLKVSGVVIGPSGNPLIEFSAGGSRFTLEPVEARNMAFEMIGALKIAEKIIALPSSP